MGNSLGDNIFSKACVVINNQLTMAVVSLLLHRKITRILAKIAFIWISQLGKLFITTTYGFTKIHIIK